MKIFTYYVRCQDHDEGAEVGLLNLWRDHWKERGVETELLTEEMAISNPYFGAFDSSIQHLPSVNSKSYELACWRRWLALAQAGGGYMSDYDVFANGVKFSPGELYPALGSLNLFQSRNICPSFVYCPAEMALRACHYFASLQYGKREINGRIHYSDMLAIEDMVTQKSDWIVMHDVVRDFQGSDGWERAPLIHFSNGSMGPRGLTPRHKHIPAILETLK